MRKYFAGFSFILLTMIATIAALNIYIYKPQLSNNNRDMSARIGNSLGDYSANRIKEVIKLKSEEFINAVFSGKEDLVKNLLDDSADYIKNPDGSSFIRYINEVNHVEGYMATDSNFEAMNQKWCIVSEQGSVLSCMELRISEYSEPVYWYLHFRESKGTWKLYMLENDI